MTPHPRPRRALDSNKLSGHIDAVSGLTELTELCVSLLVVVVVVAGLLQYPPLRQHSLFVCVPSHAPDRYLFDNQLSGRLEPVSKLTKLEIL